MRALDRSVLFFSVAAAMAAGCDLAHEVGGSDAGPIASDSAPIGRDAPSGVACGATTCAVGFVCCNASCGMCAPPGASCVDLFCGDADAGPPSTDCGGLAGITCPTGFFCDYAIDAMCGGGDQLGTCRPIPTSCPGGPPSLAVCGCDHRSYGSECEANAAGTSVARVGGCPHPTPVHLVVTATPTCGPADGPAWRFTVTSGGPACAVVSGATTTIDLWGDPTVGSASMLGDDPGASGTASFCASPSAPCVPLRGSVTFTSFVDGGAATFSYDLVDASGTHYPGNALTVEAWCTSERFCG